MITDLSRRQVQAMPQGPGRPVGPEAERRAQPGAEGRAGCPEGFLDDQNGLWAVDLRRGVRLAPGT